MGKLTKHLSPGATIEVNGEKLEIKALETEDLPDYFELAQRFSSVKGLKDDTPDEEVMSKLPKEAFVLLSRLVKRTVDISFPDEPEEERKAFASQHFSDIFMGMMEANAMAIGSQEKVKQIEELKKKRLAG